MHNRATDRIQVTGKIMWTKTELKERIPAMAHTSLPDNCF